MATDSRRGILAASRPLRHRRRRRERAGRHRAGQHAVRSSFRRQRPPVQERRREDLRRDGLREDDEGRRTCSTRSSRASTSSSSTRGGQRRVRRAAERGRRRAARSCCMHGPRKKAGGVGAQREREDAVAARQGRDGKTDHHLLVGKDVTTFARNLGFEIFADLNTPELAGPSGCSGSSRPTPALHQGPDRAREDAMRRVMFDMMHGRAHQREPHVRHDQLQRRQRPGRCLRHDDDERAGRSRFRAGSAIRRFWAPASTWTTKSAPPDPPGAAKPTCTGCARS